MLEKKDVLGENQREQMFVELNRLWWREEGKEEKNQDIQVV